MTDPITHPSAEELQAYNLGQLPEVRALAIDDHIGSCLPCCETLAGLSSADTFVGQLQDAHQVPPDLTARGDNMSATLSSHSGVPTALAEHPRYEILNLIGKGGMGDVYKATHRMMERTVALKVINRELMRKREAVDRFRREVKAAAQLSHPNIVTAHDAEQAGDVHFMVMEYVDGVNLAETVKENGKLPVEQACEYIRQAAIGLQHAHERGMVHRDIKPHHLMVTEGGNVKILDFGLASLAPETLADTGTVEVRSGLTSAGAIMGTPDFISPEQAEDARNADIRSDIYSFGATLYFLLSGQAPFSDGSVMHKLKSHAQLEPAALTSLRDDLPDELAAIVNKMMAKDPDERYLTPSEVAQALESFLQTYRPDDQESQGQEPSSGGNKSGSGGQVSGAKDMSPDWIPVLGQWLFYISMIPIALLILDMFFLSDGASDAADRTLYYVLTSVALSSIAGILAGIHQFNTGNRDNHRVNRWPKGQTMLIGVILLGAGALYLFATDHGVVRIAVNDPSLQVSILGQTITSEDGVEKPLTITPGEWPLLISKEAAGFRFHTDSFKIRRGDDITFKVEVLNDDIVVFKDGEPFDRQEIFDLRRELQDADDRSPADRNRPATTSQSKPELKITGKTVNKGTAGLPSVYDWNFEGRDADDLKVRLLLAQNGKTEVMQEFDFEELPAEFAGKVRLQVKDAATGADHKRRVNAILFVESPVPSRSTTINEDKGLTISVEAPFSNRIERADLGAIAPAQTESLIALSYWKGDMNHSRSVASMTEATEGGNATFLFVTLDWSPANPELAELQGEWETESRTEGGKQLTTENGFGGLLLQIKGNRFVIAERKPNGEKSEVNTGRIEIDSTTTPRTIDFIDRDQPSQRSLGIYEIKDGVLRICLADQGGTDWPAGERVPDTKPLKRPTTFGSPADSNFMLVEFTRNEPAKQHDIAKIQGTWQVTYSEDGGRIAPQEMLKELRFVIDEQHLTTEIGGQKSISTYKLDPSTNPKSIDLTENGRTKRAIYDLVGDTLRICIAETGQQRPTAFDSQPGSANDVIIMLKRIHAPAIAVDLPMKAISPNASSLTWVDVRALTREKLDQSLDSIITAASREKQQRARELIAPLRTKAEAGFAALEKGVAAGVEMFVSAARPSPYVEAGEDFADVDDSDALLEQISEAERGQLFVRMRSGTTPEAAIEIIAETLTAQAESDPGSEEAKDIAQARVLEFVSIGDGWFAAVGEDMLPLPPKDQALDVTPFVQAFENHQGAPIRFAWLMNDATRSEIDQTRPEADAILFGRLITTLRDMQSTTGAVWFGQRPKLVLDMEFGSQKSAQMFKAAFEELTGFIHLLSPFGSNDPDTPNEAQRMRKPSAAISLLFLDQDGANLSKTFDIGLLQRLAAAGFPWPNLFVPGEAEEEGENEDGDAVDQVEFRNGYVPGQVELIENSHVYHLADGVFIKQKKDQSVLFYLIEDSVGKYELTDLGLKFRTKGQNAGSYYLPPAPQGFVAAWITLLAEEGPEGTRFSVDESRLDEFIENLSASTTVRNLYEFRK